MSLGSASVRPTLMRFGAMLALLLSLAANGAQAGFVSGFTGSVTLSNGGLNRVNGVVNYAVFQNGPSLDWLGAFGLDLTTPGSKAVPLYGTINTTDRYVYLYQAVNTDLRSFLAELQVPINVDDVRSAGYFDKRVFLDGSGAAIGKFPNQTLGTTLLGNGTTNSGPVPASSNNASSAAPIPLQPLTAFDWGAPILVNGYSSIAFVTSNSPPTMLPGKLFDDSGNVSTGVVPGIVPEPSALALAFIGAGVLVAYRTRSRRARA